MIVSDDYSLLTTIWERQEAVVKAMSFLGRIPTPVKLDINDYEHQQFIRELGFFWLTELAESCEVAFSIPEEFVDGDKALREELIDSLHFLFEILVMVFDSLDDFLDSIPDQNQLTLTQYEGNDGQILFSDDRAWGSIWPVVNTLNLLKKKRWRIGAPDTNLQAFKIMLSYHAFLHFQFVAQAFKSSAHLLEEFLKKNDKVLERLRTDY